MNFIDSVWNAILRAEGKKVTVSDPLATHAHTRAHKQTRTHTDICSELTTFTEQKISLVAHKSHAMFWIPVLHISLTLSPRTVVMPFKGQTGQKWSFPTPWKKECNSGGRRWLLVRGGRQGGPEGSWLPSKTICPALTSSQKAKLTRWSSLWSTAW